MKKQKVRKRKVLSKRQQHRVGQNLHARKKVLSALKDLVDGWAKDRFAFVSKFLSSWYASSSLVEEAADAILEKGTVPSLATDRMIEPYDFLAQLIFARLMDHLEGEEATCFDVEILHARQAWQKFFAVLPIRFPDLSDVAQDGFNAHTSLVDTLYALYTGEVEPVLPHSWFSGIEAIQRILARIEKEVVK